MGTSPDTNPGTAPRLGRTRELALGIVAGSTLILGLQIPAPAMAAPITAAAAAVDAGSVRWRYCPSDNQPNKECAKVRVPLVYGDRSAGSARIAVARIPATGKESQRIGSLFWDAGGPGGASTQAIDAVVQRMSPRVRKHFDFVAFDPRGIGRSTPRLTDCGSPWPTLPALNPMPRWRVAQNKSADELASANRPCVRGERQWVDTMGTSTVVRDLDRLRKAVGDEQLTLWGTSYGTRIGYVYALRYPERVRALVLDGSIDPSEGYAGLQRVGGTAQDLALRFMKNHYRPGYRAIVKTLADLDEAPVPLGGGAQFTRWDWVNLAGGFVAFQDAWSTVPAVADAVAAARGAGPQADRARELLTEWKGTPNSNEGGGFSVVNCLDYADRLSAGQQARVARDNAEDYPVFGGTLTLQYAIGCAGLNSLDPDPIPLITTPQQRARVADVPALLANATHDGATPMAWAKRMQRAFDRPMIKYRSGQHVIWGAVKSRCVNRPIDNFVLSLKVPKRDRTCPFVPPTAPVDTAAAKLGGPQQIGAEAERLWGR